MAQIELKIVAESPDELQEILNGLADGSIEPQATGLTAEAGNVTPAENGTPAKRRGRPPGRKAAAEPTPATAPAPAAAPEPAPAPAAAPAPAPADGPSATDVRAKLKAVIDKFGANGPAKAKSILAEVGGSENITTLAPDKYADVIAAAEKALAATTDLLD